MKLLIIGDMRMGKDTVADMITKNFGLKKESSSHAALRIFLFDVLKDKYGLKYSSHEEAYEDRVNHRDKWYNEIRAFNKNDESRMAREILKTSDIYVGMRSNVELEACIENNVFDHIIGVYHPGKPRESAKSNTVDVFRYAQTLVLNNGSLDDLEKKVINLGLFKQPAFNGDFALIRKWAKEKGIYDSGDLKTQTLKLVEEVGELAKAVLNSDEVEVEDAIGDSVVVLTSIAQLAGQYFGTNMTIENSIDSAYRTISKRTGKMVDGTFIKDN